eukprot:6458224-Amphidinium_carterae.1
MERRCDRDLLPLPPLSVSLDVFNGGGPRQLRRLRTQRAIIRSSNEVIWSINELGGVGDFQHTLVSAAQQRPQAALQELLGSKASLYDVQGGPTNVAPIDLDLVTWPDKAGLVDLALSLPPEEAVVFNDLSLLFRGPQELVTVQGVEGVPRSYLDPQLRQGDTYVKLIRQMAKR